VAVIKLEAESLEVGQTIHVIGHKSDLTQVVTSLEVDKEAVVGLAQGDEGALKLERPVSEGDKVYLVE
jgi:putative protease